MTAMGDYEEREPREYLQQKRLPKLRVLRALRSHVIYERWYDKALAGQRTDGLP